MRNKQAEVEVWVSKASGQGVSEGSACGEDIRVSVETEVGASSDVGEAFGAVVWVTAGRARISVWIGSRDTGALQEAAHETNSRESIKTRSLCW